MSDNITLPREVVQEAVKALEFAERNHDGEQSLYTTEIAALRTALAAEQQKLEPVATVGTQSNAAWKGYDGRWSPPGDPIKVVHLLRDLPLGTLLYAAPPEDEALRRDAERLKDAMRKAMAMLDKHEPEPAGAFAVLLLALNPELQSAKNALRREDV